MWSCFYVCVWLSFEFDLHVVFPMLLYDMYFEVCVNLLFQCLVPTWACMFMHLQHFCAWHLVFGCLTIFGICVFTIPLFVMWLKFWCLYFCMFLFLQNLICSHVLMEIRCALMVVYNVYYLVFLYIYVFRMNVDGILYVI